MKACVWKTMLWAIILFASPGQMFAQSLVGTWQGTLQAPNRSLRTVIKISTTDADGLKALLYSIDQQSPGLPGTITLKGTAVKMAIPAVGGTYEGTLSADGNSINGTFTQGVPLSLNWPAPPRKPPGRFPNLPLGQSPWPQTPTPPSKSPPSSPRSLTSPVRVLP
jgi:hypothetical protein